MSSQTENFPARLADKFGVPQAEIARWCGIDKASVNRWTAVPVRHHARLLAEAKARRVRITHGDLIG